MNQRVYLKDYQPLPFAVESMDLLVRIHHDRVVVTACTVITAKTPQKSCTLDGEAKLLKIRVDGEELGVDDYQLDQTRGQLTLHHLPEDSFVLEITTELDPWHNKALMGFYASENGLFTQCEAEGFRRITYFFDRPDVLTTYTTTLVANQKKYPVLLSNGELIDQGKEGDNHWCRWYDPYPKPSYLFAMVAGDLRVTEDSFTTRSGKEVAIKFYTAASDRHRVAYAIDSLKRAMKWDEERFNLEYDLNIYMVVAVGDFNMGAMENKGLNIFNSRYVLADAASATDSDYEHIESVIGHEYFHNWTGNRVTCRDWFQLSLKEGLTVFREQEFAADQSSRAVRRIRQIDALRRVQFSEDASAMAHPVRPESYQEINNFYTATVYEKGAEVVRLYHSLLGEEDFCRGLNLYLQRHDGQAATCDDFLQAMSDAADQDLTQMALWYSQAGTPRLEITAHYDAEQSTYALTITQHLATPEGQPAPAMIIPIKVALFNSRGDMEVFRLPALRDSDGQPLSFTRPLTEALLVLREHTQQFVLHNVRENVTPSLLRGFSAPVLFDYPYRDEELFLLMTHDTDEFMRREAGQILYQRAIAAYLNAQKDGIIVPDFKDLATAWQSLLQIEQDPAFIALMLEVPEVSWLVSLFPNVREIDLYHAREALLNSLSHQNHAALIACRNRCLEHLKAATTPEYQPEYAGVRALLNQVTAYLMRADPSFITTLASDYDALAQNMTLEIGLLEAINHSDDPLRDSCLARFVERHGNHPLIMDKYFQLIASSTATSTPQALQQASKHPAFSLENPNKVFALWRTFSRNTPHFHAADGSGYRALANAIISIDRFNPQVAARLTRAFDRMASLAEPEKTLMQQSVASIAATPNISIDVGEIIERILNASA